VDHQFVRVNTGPVSVTRPQQLPGECVTRQPDLKFCAVYCHHGSTCIPILQSKARFIGHYMLQFSTAQIGLSACKRF